ncbi:hypothetical protein GCM10010512_15060 [Streptomyces thermoviolaceus subsp. thermoviolaceus]|nr:hypothetical protein GCM10010512_15060 [Streptomyces thermoviolaceus subsp. thermoviolaceus]
MSTNAHKSDTLSIARRLKQFAGSQIDVRKWSYRQRHGMRTVRGAGRTGFRPGRRGTVRARHGAGDGSGWERTGPAARWISGAHADDRRISGAHADDRRG